jgi:peptidase M41-like protein
MAEGCPARRSSIPRNASKKRLQNAEGQHKPLGDVYNDSAQRSARKMGVFFNREETSPRARSRDGHRSCPAPNGDRHGDGDAARHGPAQPFLPGVATDRIQAAEITVREIDVAVRDIIAREFERATEILSSRRADMEKGVELLLAKETVTAEDFPLIRPAGTAPATRPAILAKQSEPVS